MEPYIVISPLDWGMGHITRMIPVGEYLCHKGYKVIFVVPDNCRYLIKEHNFRTIHIKGYNVKYYTKIPLVFSLILQIPKFIFTAISEIMFVRRLEKKSHCHLIISDNRPFMRSSKIFSAYVTHQINIKNNSVFNCIINKIHQKIIRRFDCCLIPDTAEHQLSGELTKPILKDIKTIFLGPLSRFNKIRVNSNNQVLYKYDMAVIVSGPNPHRSHFAKSIVKTLNSLEGNFVVIGCPNSVVTNCNNIKTIPHLNMQAFAEVLMQSKKVVSLAGYTTIMDMAVLNKNLIIIPTKRQGEQEYLAEYHKNHKTIHPIKNLKEIGDLLETKVENSFEEYLEMLDKGIEEILFFAKIHADKIKLSVMSQIG